MSLQHRSHASAASQGSSNSSSSSTTVVEDAGVVSPAPPSAGERLLFLTVGTTQFDQLVASLNEHATPLATWLAREGFERFVLQIGTGRVLPGELQRAAAGHTRADGRPATRVEWFRHSPDIISWMSHSSLIISHAGAGSILEALRLARPLLVVTNTRLMHNHQVEVARALEADHFLYQTSPEHVLDVLRAADWTPPNEEEKEKEGEKGSQSDSESLTRYRLRRYPDVESAAFPTLLDQHANEMRQPSGAAFIAMTYLLPAAIAFAATWTIFG